MDFSRSNVLNIFIGVIFIFALIIIMDIINFNLNTKETNKKVVQVVNIEALQNNTDTNTTINLNPISDFCKSSSDSLKTSCGKLTKKNCNATTCCVMLNGEK